LRRAAVAPSGRSPPVASRAAKASADKPCSRNQGLGSAARGGGGAAVAPQPGPLGAGAPPAFQLDRDSLQVTRAPALRAQCSAAAPQRKTGGTAQLC
jgi:hypothetical protein